MSRITLVPAYGRDYKSKKQIQEDLIAEKDFIISDFSNPWDGKYANLQQLHDYDELNIRYKKLANVAVFKTADLIKLQQKKASYKKLTGSPPSQIDMFRML